MSAFRANMVTNNLTEEFIRIVQMPTQLAWYSEFSAKNS
jgi:hypothetical protein